VFPTLEISILGKERLLIIIQNPKWKQEYAIEINNRVETLENIDDEDNIDSNLNEKWESIEMIVNIYVPVIL
jgi:hypothetical protein